MHTGSSEISSYTALQIIERPSELELEENLYEFEGKYKFNKTYFTEILSANSETRTRDS